MHCVMNGVTESSVLRRCRALRSYDPQLRPTRSVGAAANAIRGCFGD